jgi:hypothetical protein
MENRLLEPPAVLPGITRSLPTHILKQPTPKFLQQLNLPAQDFSGGKKIPVKFKPIKRVTPFLLFEFILPVILIYLISTGKEVNILFQLGLFLFLEINIMFLDFAVWNYFEGKKQTRIWLIEAPLVFLILSFIV